MGGLAGADVVRDATIEETSQAVFSASPLGALESYIIWQNKSVQFSGKERASKWSAVSDV
jgi:hypothetical protein